MAYLGVKTLRVPDDNTIAPILIEVYFIDFVVFDIVNNLFNITVCGCKHRLVEAVIIFQLTACSRTGLHFYVMDSEIKCVCPFIFVSYRTIVSLANHPFTPKWKMYLKQRPVFKPLDGVEMFV